MKARACGATRRSALSRWMGLVAESVLVQFLCQVENPAGQLRVLCKRVVDVRVVGGGLLLLEDGLTVLADHHERREEDRLEGHDEGQRRPRALLDDQHPR